MVVISEMIRSNLGIETRMRRIPIRHNPSIQTLRITTGSGTFTFLTGTFEQAVFGLACTGAGKLIGISV